MNVCLDTIVGLWWVWCFVWTAESLCPRRQTPVIMVPSSVLIRPTWLLLWLAGLDGCVRYTQLKLLAHRRSLGNVFWPFFWAVVLRAILGPHRLLSPSSAAPVEVAHPPEPLFVPIFTGLVRRNSCPQGRLPCCCPATWLVSSPEELRDTAVESHLRLPEGKRRIKTRQPINTIQPLNVQ